MAFIKEASSTQSKKDKKQALEKLRGEFEGLSQQSEHGIFGLFDLESWLDSKITGIPFAEIVRSKFVQN